MSRLHRLMLLVNAVLILLFIASVFSLWYIEFRPYETVHSYWNPLWIWLNHGDYADTVNGPPIPDSGNYHVINSPFILFVVLIIVNLFFIIILKRRKETKQNPS